MKLLITGIAGFIGSKIAEAALKKGHKIIGIDDLSQGYFSNIPEGIEFFKLDLAKPENIQYLPQDIDVILHLAGQSSGEISFDDPVVDLEKNAISTLNLIKYGIQIKAQKIIYASSMSVYGPTKDAPVSEDQCCIPLSCYGTGKLTAENYLKIYKDDLPHVIFRMFNVYGPGQDMTNLRQGMVSIYLAYILKNKKVLVKGDLQRFRDFIYIDDVVTIWLQAIENKNIYNQTFNLGTGIKTTVFELLSSFRKIFPDFSWGETEGTLGDQFGIYADKFKLDKFFSIPEFTPLDKGLKLFVEWALKKN